VCGTALAVFGLSGCLMVDLSRLGQKELDETVIEKGRGRHRFEKILLVDLSGMIAEDPGGLFGDAVCSPAYVKAVLRKAEEDRRIRAVVLRIDSPGGTVAASETIAREIRAFHARTRKPVLAQITSLGCSGGYYIAVAADSIAVQPSGITGSIGVIAILPKYRQLADKIGYDQVVIKSGAMKDIGSGLRDMTPEERAVLQGMIDASYAQFLDWIQGGRPQMSDRAALKKAADGRIYTATQARDLGLVDRVAYLDETIQDAGRIAGVPGARVVAYAYGPGADMNIYSPVSRTNPLKIDLGRLSPLGRSHAGFYYLWTPGE
jgi:protease-4